MNTVPGPVFRQVAEEWLARFEFEEDAFQLLEVNGRVSASSWRKRLADTTYQGRVKKSGEPGTRQLAWFARAELDIHDVDEFVIAADATDLWHIPPLDAYAEERPSFHCHDCGKPIEPGDYRPLELFRHVPDAPGGIVWDSTKLRWARRPKNAAAGGRRFRWYDLCRRCAGEALRQRSMSGSVMKNGVSRPLRTKERIAPKRGGRPRLLDDVALRRAHAAYVTTGLSRNEIARRMHESGKYPGALKGLEQALLYGWRRLHLELRPRGVQYAMSRFGTDGTKSKHHKVRCSHTLTNGRRCTQWVRRIVTETGSHPAPDGRCWNHRSKGEEDGLPAQDHSQGRGPRRHSHAA